MGTFLFISEILCPPEGGIKKGMIQILIGISDKQIL